MQCRIEKHARDAAGGMGKIERVRAIAAGHAAAGDLRRSMQIDAEGIDDRERIVGKKLATEFVARKGVAVDECDGVAAPRQQRGQRRAARAGTDDCDICVNLRHLRMKTLSADYADERRFLYSSSPNRNGITFTTST